MTDVYNYIFKLDDVEALNDTFDKYGYSSLYAIQNLGTLAATIVLIPVLWILSWSIYIVLLGCKDYKVPWHKKLDRFVFYNGTFVTIDESYLLFAMAAALNTFYLKWDTYGNKSNVVFSFSLWGVVIGAPFFFYCFFSSRSNI